MKGYVASIVALFALTSLGLGGSVSAETEGYTTTLQTADVVDAAGAISSGLGFGTPVSMTVSFPTEGEGPFPAVVIQHGAGGVGEREADWAAVLNDAGYATAIVDTFTGETERGPRLLGNSQADHTVDAYAALRALQGDARIDPARIAHLGMSRGAMSMIIGADRRVETVLAPAEGFAAHVLLYPNCYPGWRNPQPTDAPIYMMLGGADDLALASVCQSYAQQLTAAGGTVDVITYPDAAHAFDAAFGVNRIEGSANGADCVIVIEDDGTFVLSESGASTRDTTWREFLLTSVFPSPCVKQGYTAGGTEATQARAFADALAFLGRTL